MGAGKTRADKPSADKRCVDRSSGAQGIKGGIRGGTRLRIRRRRARGHKARGHKEGRTPVPTVGRAITSTVGRARQGRATSSIARIAREGATSVPSPARSSRTRRATGPKPRAARCGCTALHAVAAALANPARRLRRLVVTEEAEAALAQRLPPPWPLQPERVERGRLDQLLGRDIAHQGAALLADPLAPPSLQYVLDRPGPIVVLDQVTDPRNVGAILRSAASFGAAAVITQDRNAPEETGALAKAASGALETMPLLRAVNIARTLIALKAANIWVVGLDAGGGTLAGPALAGRRVALVLGAEGSGLRRLTRETCDEIAGFAMQGAVGSLNVSAAAAVALYELTRKPEAQP